MPALYDQTGALIASGFDVLSRESRLTQRRTDVVHDLALGGLPYVVRKDPAGLSGNIEFLCPSSDMADAIYAAHLSGPVRLDTYTELTNRLTNPSFETDGAWGRTGSIVSVTQSLFNPLAGLHSAVVLANTAPTSTTSGVTQDLSGPVAPGEWVAARIPVRPGGTVPTPRVRLSIQFWDSSDALLVNSISPTIDPPSFTFTALTWSAQAPAGTVSARLAMYLSNQTTDIPDANSEASTDAWIAAVADTQADALAGVTAYFDGDVAPPGYASRWDGVANASTSSLGTRPALDLTYVPVAGVAVPVRESLNHWRVSVPSIQEVAA